MYALPGRHGEGRQTHGERTLGAGSSQRAFLRHARCVDLRSGSGGAESADLRDEIFSRGIKDAARTVWKQAARKKLGLRRGTRTTTRAPPWAALWRNHRSLARRL